MKHRTKSKRTIAARGRKAGRSAGRAAGTTPMKARPESPAPGSEPRTAALPLAEGTVITRRYKGRDIRVTVLAEGFRWEGQDFRSLTAVALRVTGYPTISGPHFFRMSRRATSARRTAGPRSPRHPRVADASPAPSAPGGGAESSG